MRKIDGDIIMCDFQLTCFFISPKACYKLGDITN